MDAESVFVYPRGDSAIDRAEVAGRRARGWDVDERVARVSGAHHARRTMASVFGSFLGLELSRGASL
jgi:hypothetical protein